MAGKVTRREFVRNTAVVAGATVFAPTVLAQASPNKTLGVAIVAVGGMGGYNVDASMGEKVVAIADIDDNNIKGALDSIRKNSTTKSDPKVYNDYRKMLDECKKDIDVVLIATPDHNHAPASIRAIHLGKHTFCQKPLCHNIAEVQAVMKAAKAKKVLTQMGNQGHCGEGLRRACEYIWAGAVGNITETHSLLGRNFGGTGERPETKPVPPGVHWDEWIGPAPFRDYHDGLHPFSWRSWRDFGTGNVGDMACHNLDCMFFALKIMEAKKFTVECVASNGGSKEMWAQDNIVRYVIPPRAGMPELTSYVYDRKEIRPDIMKQTEQDCQVEFNEDTLYIGDKGKFYTTGTAGQARILPREKHAEYPPPPKTLPRAQSESPIEDLFLCIKNGGTPASNFPGQSGPLTIFALLGHLAQNAGVGVKLEWDAEKSRVTNLPEYNRFLKRTYRKGWEV